MILLNILRIAQRYKLELSLLSPIPPFRYHFASIRNAARLFTGISDHLCEILYIVLVDLSRHLDHYTGLLYNSLQFRVLSVKVLLL